MPTYEFNESAAGTAVGTDIAAGVRGQVDPARRWLSAIAVLGSAAAGDAAVDIYVGDTYIGRVRNTTAGASPAPDSSKDIQPVGVGLNPNEQLHLIVADASGTNALRCICYFDYR